MIRTKERKRGEDSMSEIRYSMRIKLTDFIKSNQEEDVINAVHKCAENTGKKIFLKLWYKENDISQDDLIKFLSKYEKKLEDIGTNIHMGENESWMQKSWYNLRSKLDKNDTSYRHEYVYVDIQGIIYGIELFANMIKSMERTSKKPQPPPNILLKENQWKPKHRIIIKRIHNEK